MTPQSSPPSYGTSGSPSGSAPTNGSPQRMALDNILRRELRVSDPNDPMQIAQALLTRYQDTPRAQAISQEAKGLPFLQAAPMQALVPQAATSSDAELQQAKDDVDRDLHELTTSSLLKDVTPEIQGWGQAVRSAITEGTTAARFALDPRQRDKAFGVRRQLGDYARMARLVGALTPTLNLTYRKFAQSLDEVAAVILVTMGESLANVGFNGGRFLLQAPYSELQARRDAAIYALRNLIGATQQAYGPNDWPRGLDAYRKLFNLLERQGQGDLRALLVEHELSRTMDELIQRAAHGRAEGLRALGSTAQLDLERFRRMVIIGQRVVSPESPPLAAFLEALQLFADAFESSGGFRLLRVARPPILFYGLYGTTVLEDADRRLVDLIILRGLLADQLDCFLQCGCTAENVRCQIVLDKVLYDLDRAIDLYALGHEDFGEPERRASAYSFVIEQFLLRSQLVRTNGNPTGCTVPADLATFDGAGASLTGGILDEIMDKLRPAVTFENAEADPDVSAVVTGLLDFAGQVRDLSPASLEADLNTLITNLEGIRTVIDIHELTPLFSRLQQADAATVIEDNNLQMPEVVTDYLGMLQQELCIQEDMEARWRNLVKSMAPNCFGLDAVLNAVEQVIEGAISLVSGQQCPTFQPSIPPHFETSLDSLANEVEPDGTNRR